MKLEATSTTPGARGAESQTRSLRPGQLQLPEPKIGQRLILSSLYRIMSLIQTTFTNDCGFTTLDGTPVAKKQCFKHDDSKVQRSCVLHRSMKSTPTCLGYFAVRPMSSSQGLSMWPCALPAQTASDQRRDSLPAPALTFHSTAVALRVLLIGT